MKSRTKSSILALFLPALPFWLAVADASAAEPYCREFTREIVVGGQPQSGYGTACLQPDGSWQIVAESYEGAAERVGDTIVIQNQPDVVVVRPQRVYEAQSYGYGYGLNAGTGGVSLNIGTYYPYYGYHYSPYRYRNDPHRRHFYRYHRGPGWQKHYEQHRKVLK